MLAWTTLRLCIAIPDHDGHGFVQIVYDIPEPVSSMADPLDVSSQGTCSSIHLQESTIMVLQSPHFHKLAMLAIPAQPMHPSFICYHWERKKAPLPIFILAGLSLVFFPFIF